MKTKNSILLFWILPFLVFGTTLPERIYRQVSGKVTDENGVPLAAANVMLPALNLGTTTNKSGEFVFEKVSLGRHRLVVSFIGYTNYHSEIEVKASDLLINVQLKPTILMMPALNVTAAAAPTDVLTSNRTVSVLSKHELESQHANSMSDALRTVPGVQTVEQGPMIAKPIIRGMTNQRIVILKDGIKHEAQQWSNHHTPESDFFEAERVEVLRGPASLLYGSGAIGGVVQILSHEPVTAANGAPAFGMNVTTQMFTNTAQGAGALRLYGAAQRYGWHLNISGRKSQYYAVPGRRHFLVKQLDTGFEQWHVDGALGFVLGNLNLRLGATHYDEEQTLIGEGHWHNSGGPDGGPWYHAAGAIKSPTVHQKAQLSADYRFGVHRLEWNLATQRDHRQGIPSGMVPQVDLESFFTESNLKVHHVFNSFFPGVVGLSFCQKIDKTYGVEVLIPNSDVHDVGVYFLQNYLGFQRLSLSLGARMDLRAMNFKETIMQRAFLDENRQIVPAYIVPEGKKTYHGIVSGSLGVVWHEPTSPFSMAGNIGTGWRAPTPVELYIRGVHHASYEYMIGDPSLQAEKAINADIIFRWVTQDVVYEFNGFYNRIYDYIFANPTGEFHYLGFRENIPIYRFEQNNARLYGFEWHNQFRLSARAGLEFGYDLVRGEILSPMIDADQDGRLEKNLPSISPDRFHAALTFHLGDMLFLRHIQYRLAAEHYFRQDKLGEFENVMNRDADGDGRNDELISEKYSLLHTSLSAEAKLFGLHTNLSALIRNLTNEKYYSHLSNYKGIAYNPGFDFSLLLKIQL